MADAGNITPDKEPQAQPAEAAEQKPFKTKGQLLHHWGTYLSVDWVFNAATGVAFAYWGKFSELGKKCWSGPITRGFEKALGRLTKNPESLAKSAERGNMFVSIIAGGMFTIPPLMALESKKVRKSIVQFFDKKIYGKQAVEEDPKFKEAYEAIDNAPKKGFFTGMAARGAALAPLLAIVLWSKSKALADKAWFNHVANGSEWAFTKAGATKERMFSKLSPEQAEERWKFIHNTMAMDFGLGVPYAILHSAFYNMFVGKGKKQSPEDEPQAPLLSASFEQPEAKPLDIDSKNHTQQIERKPAVTQRAHFADYAKPQESEAQHAL